MDSSIKKQIAFIYDVSLPVCAVISLFSLMSLGAAYFHPRQVSFSVFIFNHLLWLLFTFDFISRLCIVNNFRHFLTSHLAELISILPIAPAVFVLDMLGSINLDWVPQSIFNFIFLATFFAYLCRVFIMQRRFFKTNQLHYALAITFTALVIAAFLFAKFEGRSYSDGIWWAFVTASTTGFGDVVPATQGGRVVGMFLMVVGLACISMLTGIIAGRLMHGGSLRYVENENIKFIIQRLSYFHSLSTSELDEICVILKAVKENQVMSDGLTSTNLSNYGNDSNKCHGKFLQFLRSNFKPDPKDDSSLEDKFIK
ncbi:MAG: potassium channel family protein [Synergistaceae bacterium]